MITKTPGSTKTFNIPFAGVRLTVTLLLAVGLVLLTSIRAGAQVSVLTYHNDGARTGQNTNETNLTLADVNTNTFGLLFRYSVDGYLFGQPLILTNVSIPGRGVHNVLYVATQHESVYAFDADNNQGSNAFPLWQTSFVNSAAGITSVNAVKFAGNGLLLGPEIGITATPVIDPVNGALFIVSYTTEVSDGVTNYVHRLHALDVSTGLEKAGSPVQIICTNYPGTGDPAFRGDHDGDGHVAWNGSKVFDRPALLLDNGFVFVGMGSHIDAKPFHGWVFAYNAQTLEQTGVFQTTPNGEGAALWMSGGGPAADANHNVYFLTGNGDFTTNSSSPSGYSLGDSFVKLSGANGLTLSDYFTPSNEASLNAVDEDLGSGGLVVLPDSVGSSAHPHLVVGAGKEGILYLVDRDNMGQFSAVTNQIVQQVPDSDTVSGVWPGGSFATPSYFNNRIYYKGNLDYLKAFSVGNGLISPAPVSASKVKIVYGGSIAISANGTNNAIVWEINGDNAIGASVLYAFDAYDLTHQLYNSAMAPANRDAAGGEVEYVAPSVANGKVYVPCRYELDVFGNGVFLAAPKISPPGATYTNSVSVSITDTTPGVSLYYTLDGTAPTTNSLVYGGPLQLTNSAALNVVAAKPGAVNSAVVSASFVNSSSAGIGTGLTGSYYSNVLTSQVFDYALTPAFTRVDPTINFKWTSKSPASSIPATNFEVRWTGMVQPQYNGNYNFFLQTDGNVRLLINGQQIIYSGNTITSPETVSYGGSMALQAQQFYNVEIDYYFFGANNFDSPDIEFLWSNPYSSVAMVPESQLYPETNSPPEVFLTTPTNGGSYAGNSTLTLSAQADAQYNQIASVSFYLNGLLLGTETNAPYTLAATDLAVGNYTITAVASDTTGLITTSAPVTVSAGSDVPYGLATNGTVAPFLNRSMPGAFNGVFSGGVPNLLSQAGPYVDMLNRVPAPGLVPYLPNTPLWSDGATKSRYLAVPNNLAPIVPSEQIAFASTGQWSFPSGTVFVKNFDLVVNQTNSSVPLRRLETRLLVRDTNGGVYGVTYKWRLDYSDADLLTNSLSEAILITNSGGVHVQNWYYPSPQDCLICHTPVAGGVLGLNTRQLNGTNTYSSTGIADNQLRTLNHLGLLNPALNEAGINVYESLSSVTNPTAPLVQRVRSYLDANCAQCHQPGGTGSTFDARYDTPLASQNIIGVTANRGNLGYAYMDIVTPQDPSHSAIFDRIDTTDSTLQMPPLARRLIDTDAVATFAAWINSLPEPPPVISPPGGFVAAGAAVTIQPLDPGAIVYYTLDGTTPTTNSSIYSDPITLTNSTVITAVDGMPGGSNSVETQASFVVPSPIYGFTGGGLVLNNGATVTNDTLVLTDSSQPEAHSAFFQGQQFVNSFQAQFIYRALRLPGGGLSDGAAFVLQNAGTNALGSLASGLGYKGIQPSVALELNVCNCTGLRGILLATNGEIGYPGSKYAAVLPVDLTSEDPIQVTLNYNGLNLAVELLDLTTGDVFTTNYSINIPSIVGGNAAYIGFTGGDGDVHWATIQTISEFSFTPNGTPPHLTVAMKPTKLSISWPVSSFTYGLQYTTNLTAPHWQRFPIIPSVVGGQATVAIPIGSTNTFFRLIAQ